MIYLADKWVSSKTTEQPNLGAALPASPAVAIEYGPTGSKVDRSSPRSYLAARSDEELSCRVVDCRHLQQATLAGRFPRRSRRDELTCLAALPCPVLPLLAGVHVELAIAASAEQHPSPLICKRLSAALRALALFVDLHDLTPHSPWTPQKTGPQPCMGGHDRSP